MKRLNCTKYTDETHISLNINCTFFFFSVYGKFQQFATNALDTCSTSQCSCLPLRASPPAEV